MKTNDGFTLIELVVVTGIVVGISTIMGAVLYSTLKGTETTRANTAIAQNGNYAMSIMSENIKRAKRVTEVGGSADFQQCTEEGLVSDSIQFQMADGKHITLQCDDAAGVVETFDVESGSSTQLTESNSNVTLVPGSCKFTCFQKTMFNPPRIQIEFSLGQPDQSQPGQIIPKSTTLFQTVVNIRNYGD